MNVLYIITKCREKGNKMFSYACYKKEKNINKERNTHFLRKQEECL